jgi:hypothetical protein
MWRNLLYGKVVLRTSLKKRRFLAAAMSWHGQKWVPFFNRMCPDFGQYNAIENEQGCIAYRYGMKARRTRLIEIVFAPRRSFPNGKRRNKICMTEGSTSDSHRCRKIKINFQPCQPKN